GLYRERVGMLFVRARSGAEARIAFSNVLTLARTNWSMPPDHGAAAVALILEDDALRADWRRELDSMRARIASVRAELAAADPAFAALGRQKGMFSMLPLSKDSIDQLRKDKALYMAGSGRISVCGLTPGNLPRFVDVMRNALAADRRA
ncbi:MAG: aminotransferase class I/II-fold pyridoxal phosphate-dependent enzyme, partial [Pseudomonadota bacterium]|nr:aminotransferase class I/II-fold pyridoxal phosphate-dependent enzyme [Pseudomonadota bacterium]